MEKAVPAAVMTDEEIDRQLAAHRRTITHR
jgi:hypothetical protein